MPDETNPNTIGDPEPYKPSGGSTFLTTLAAYVAVVCGSIYTFTTLIVPVRCQGATRSSRLRWQQQQTEAHKTIAAQDQIVGPGDSHSPPKP